MGPYGPIWVRPGPLKSGKSSKKQTSFLHNTFLWKIIVFDLHITFLLVYLVLQISDRNTLQNDYKITSKSKFSNQNLQFWYLLHRALSYSLSFLIVCFKTMCNSDMVLSRDDSQNRDDFIPGAGKSSPWNGITLSLMGTYQSGHNKLYYFGYDLCILPRMRSGWSDV